MFYKFFFDRLSDRIKIIPQSYSIGMCNYQKHEIHSSNIEGDQPMGLETATTDNIQRAANIKQLLQLKINLLIRPINT